MSDAKSLEAECRPVAKYMVSENMPVAFRLLKLNKCRAQTEYRI